MPLLLAGNKEQQKKFFVRLVEEPLVTVSIVVSSVTLRTNIKLIDISSGNCCSCNIIIEFCTQKSVVKETFIQKENFFYKKKTLKRILYPSIT